VGEKHFVNPNYNSIPVEFEQVSNILDDRFMKVKIWIAHTGENRNNSIFSKEVLESMIPSLANVPILGYIEVSEDNEKDFKGHEEKLVVEDGKFKLKYFGRAYGVIPVENNARFETRFGEDGVEREYLVCEGLIWRKFQEVEEIFDRDSGYKWQSMELQHSSVKGYVNDEGLFVFTQAKFEGACILGEDVTPAMVSSTIEKFSVADKIQADLKEMLHEFNTHFSATKEKGDDTVPTNEEIKNTENTEFEEQTQEETPVVEEPQGEEPADNFEEEQPQGEENPAEPQENFAKDGEEDEEEDDEEKDSSDEEDEEEDEEDNKKFTRTFELSHDDIRAGLYGAFDQHESFKDTWIWISKVYDNYCIVEDEVNGKYFKVNYVKHENAVSLGEHVELFPMFLTQEEKATIDASRNNFEALEKEVNDLREFKANIEMSEKEQKLAQYSSTLSKEEFDSIKSNLANFSMEDIEKEIGFILLKKNHFSANKQDEVLTRVNATPSVETNPYGSLATYFHK
jgi:hypothetical protein